MNNFADTAVSLAADLRISYIKQQSDLVEKQRRIEQQLCDLICTLKPGDETTVPLDHWNSHKGQRAIVRRVHFDGRSWRADQLGYMVHAAPLKKDGTPAVRTISWQVIYNTDGVKDA